MTTQTSPHFTLRAAHPNDNILRRKRERDTHYLIKSLKRPTLQEIEDINTLLRDYYNDCPDAMVLWAENNFKFGRTHLGYEFSILAVKNALHDNKPGLIISKIAKLIEKYDDPKLAKKLLAQSLTILPNDAFLVTTVAKQFWQSGDIDQSITLLEEWNKKIKDDAALKTSLAKAYQHAGRHDEALTVLAQAYAEHPFEQGILSSLSNALIESGAPELALTHLLASHENGTIEHNNIPLVLLAYASNNQFDQAIDFALKNNNKQGALKDSIQISILLEHLEKNNQLKSFIEHLHHSPLHPDKGLARILAETYIYTNNRNAFEGIKPLLFPQTTTDLLEARFDIANQEYFNALKTLTPHINSGTKNTDILSLYLTCANQLGELNTFNILKSKLDKTHFDAVINSSRQWDRTILRQRQRTIYLTP